MRSVLIRQIPEKTLEGLKRRAKRHRRSLQQEILVLLEESALMQSMDSLDSEELQLYTVKAGGESSWNREEIYENGER